MIISALEIPKYTSDKCLHQWVSLHSGMKHKLNKYTTKEGRKEVNVLFHDSLNTFYLRLYAIRHMVKDHSDSERGNPLPPHGLLFPISSNIPQTG